MNQSKINQIVLYITLTLALIALLVGSIGLIRVNNVEDAASTTPTTQQGSSGAAQQPPSGANVQTVTPDSGSGATSGTTSR